MLPQGVLVLALLEIQFSIDEEHVAPSFGSFALVDDQQRRRDPCSIEQPSRQPDHRFNQVILQDAPPNLPQSFSRNAHCVKAHEIMPVSRQTLATMALLAAEDVDGSCLLPERPLRQHGCWACLGKHQTGKTSRCIAHDGLLQVRFTCRPGSKLDHDLWANEAAIFEQRLVADVETLFAGMNLCSESGGGEPFCNTWAGCIPNPFCETSTNGLRPALLLTSVAWQGLVAGVEDQVRREGTDVVGDVHVFGEPADRPINL